MAILLSCVSLNYVHIMVMCLGWEMALEDKMLGNLLVCHEKYADVSGDSLSLVIINVSTISVPAHITLVTMCVCFFCLVTEVILIVYNYRLVNEAQ